MCVTLSSVVMLSTVDGAPGEPQQGRNTRPPGTICQTSGIAPQSRACFKGIGLKVFEGFVSVRVFEYESAARQKLELASL